MTDALRNWKTTAVGLLLALFGVVQMTKAPSFKDALTNPTTQIALVGAALGFFAKDADKTGTTDKPRP